MQTNSQKGNVSALVIFVIVVVIVAVGYLIYKGSSQTSVSMNEQATTPTTTVSIMVPADMAAYVQAMNEYVSQGGTQNPASSTQFIAKTVTVATTTDVVRAAAEAAANTIQSQAGTTTVQYLKIVNGTAYILFNTDLNGWAGVSFYQAKVHPIVTETLLQFPGIKSVVFGTAPGDKIPTGEQSIDSNSSNDSAWKSFTVNPGPRSSLTLKYPTTWDVTDIKLSCENKNAVIYGIISPFSIDSGVKSARYLIEYCVSTTPVLQYSGFVTVSGTTANKVSVSDEILKSSQEYKIAQQIINSAQFTN